MSIIPDLYSSQEVVEVPLTDENLTWIYIMRELVRLEGERIRKR